jgi:hypothetical protein
MLIRNEEEKDWADVHALNSAAAPLLCWGMLSTTRAPVSRFGLSCEYEVPEEVFMMVELQPGFLKGASGKVKYHAAFSNL